MVDFFRSYLRFETRAELPLRALVARWAVMWGVLLAVFFVAASLFADDAAGKLLVLAGLPVIDLVMLLGARICVRRLDRSAT